MLAHLTWSALGTAFGFLLAATPLVAEKITVPIVLHGEMSPFDPPLEATFSLPPGIEVVRGARVILSGSAAPGYVECLNADDQLTWLATTLTLSIGNSLGSWLGVDRPGMREAVRLVVEESLSRRSEDREKLEAVGQIRFESEICLGWERGPEGPGRVTVDASRVQNATVHVLPDVHMTLACRWVKPATVSVDSVAVVLFVTRRAY